MIIQDRIKEIIRNPIQSLIIITLSLLAIATPLFDLPSFLGAFSLAGLIAFYHYCSLKKNKSN